MGGGGREPACARRLRRSGRASRDRWDRRAAGGRRRVGVATLAGVAVATATSHVSGVLTLSILGFMLAIFFIFASAPDLALTQLVVETLILLIFLLVLQRLPSFYSEIRPLSIARDAGVSILVGAMAFVAVLLTIPSPDADPTSVATYYTEQAVPGGGGTNVVNVILVDFRAFDTLGELLVVTIAAIAILVLVTMRTRGEASVTEGDEEPIPDGVTRRDDDDHADDGPGDRSHRARRLDLAVLTGPQPARRRLHRRRSHHGGVRAHIRRLRPRLPGVGVLGREVEPGTSVFEHRTVTAYRRTLLAGLVVVLGSGFAGMLIGDPFLTQGTSTSKASRFTTRSNSRARSCSIWACTSSSSAAS